MQSALKRRAPGTITPGMWVMHDGHLGIAFKNPALIPTTVEREVDVPDREGGGTHKEKRKVIERIPDPSKVEVHYVNAKTGETEAEHIVPLSSVRQATYAEIKKQPRAAHVTLAQAYELGYDSSDAGRKAAELAQQERRETAAKMAAKVEFEQKKSPARK